MSDTFDDRKLINLARFHFYSAKEVKESGPSVQKLFEKEKLTNEERNKILQFIEENRDVRPLGIAAMKREIFRLIGAPDVPNSYPTVNRNEVEHIYNFIKGVKRGK